ncbi:MAG: biopolymer transporter ExbD [Pseudomonadota bacterium]
MIDLSNENQTEEYESILPLVNVVFLLLIFFMLAGAFTTPDAFKVSPPIAELENKTQAREGLILINQQGMLAYDGKELTKTELRQKINNLVKNSDKEPPKFKIKADAASDSLNVITIIELLQELNVKQVELLTIQK